MVGQRSISGHWDHVTDHFAMWSDKMAGRKRASSSVSEISSSDGAPASKRGCYWPIASTSGSQRYDEELDMCTWLKYTIIDRLHVDALMCFICTCFKRKLEGMRNYNPAYIKGSRNLRTSSFVFGQK